MESASPTASASTNRGGRPKDWTETRTRRLIRLYLFTTLPFAKILELLEEDEFKPGKDAANKVKNGVLGNDPRWIRPKDDDEEKARLRGLRNSFRGRQSRRDADSHHAHGHSTAAAAEHNPVLGAFPEDASLGGATLAHSHRSSTEDVHHGYPHYTHTNDPTFNLTHDHTFNSTSNHPTTAYSGASPPRFIPSLIGRFNTSRQDTGLTTSTNISVASVFRKKLSAFPINKAMRAVKVLKRYTFPKNLDPSRTSDAPSGLCRGFEPYSPASRINDPFAATHVVPGDFLNTERFADPGRCAAESPAHADGVCWCKVADQVYQMQKVWATIEPPRDLSDPHLEVKDIFGNTIFHHLATKEGIQEQFLYIVCQALRKPYLPVRNSNTAGQTFLHVLHHSWFQEGSKLDDLIETLRGENFDLLATDVYGRSFFHILREYRRGSVRFPGQGFDVYRLNRRDAFGLKPMNVQQSPDTYYPVAHTQTFHGTNAATSAAFAIPTPSINTQVGMGMDKELRANTDLLRVINSETGSDSSTPRNITTENSQGWNGFHCLAEVDLHLSLDTPKHSSRGHFKDDSRPNPQGHQKRKHNNNDEAELPQTVSDSRRFQALQSLIHARADANHYDKRGSTPLMSFVVNSSDATKYEKEESEKIIRALVKEAGARLELRNRNGETALHLAARYGKIVALRVLLDLGANPHTRNAQGLSILEVLDSLYATTVGDDKINARFEAARAILTRTADSAVQTPDIVDEWAIKPGFIGNL
ncbi:putative ankyrin repeat protein [Rosellinia necatrix]|uniref:Putative ankyrin repeat protein n=1 Tax=Rosellinia necatrix TaxID=77044 RepID=A0A1W2TCL2_ROSNE|nr:putative ankyrin repeat protein [Rosellinia necatrix]